MALPVVAITNASTCLNDEQVEAVLRALQKQVSDDFKAYWEQDCKLLFLPKDQPLTHGWWHRGYRQSRPGWRSRLSRDDQSGNAAGKGFRQA